jgi:hypothetical protein
MVNTNQYSQDCRVMNIENASKWVSSVGGELAPSVQFQVSPRVAVKSAPASPSGLRDVSPVDYDPGSLDVVSNTAEPKMYMFNPTKYETKVETHTAIL